MHVARADLGDRGSITAGSAEEAGELTDEQLLGRFVERGDEAAFRALVRRHAPLVLARCRQVLNQREDAEDAAQAAFLVLARRAGSIRERRAVGRWLDEVAYRIALRARTAARRRRLLERREPRAAVATPEEAAAWNDLRPVIHDAVHGLPEKYRAPVVLCYLEGKTNVEVARVLRWPVGTVKGRLSRARDLLRTRLGRHAPPPAS